MKLYHGSTEAIMKPIILENQRFLDFGKGFYTTSSREQAEKWALLKQKRIGKPAKAIVSVYEIDENLLLNNHFSVKYFLQANEEWLDFVVSNRKSLTNHPYDVVPGAVANDTLYATLLLFESGLLSKSETIVRLKTHQLFDQISFHNQRVLAELRFSEQYDVVS